MSLIGDEEIIKLRVAARKAHELSNLNDIIIDGTLYQFEKREFIPDFSMVLPKSFTDLAPEYILKKYPNVNRPKLILSNHDTDVTFTFERLAPQTEELESRGIKYQSVIKKIHPSYNFFSEHTYNLANGLTVACYDYQCIALDDDIYCLHFFTDLPLGELLGSFTCPIEAQEQWEPLVRQMLLTIKPLPRGEEEETKNA